MIKKIVIFLIIFSGFNVCIQAQDNVPIHLIQTIPLKNVRGRIDHLTFDSSKQRLFVTVLGNNTLEIVDLQTGKQTRTLTGFHEPQGVLFLSDLNELIVTNAEDGTCQMLKGDSFEVIKTVRLSSDADNIRYDTTNRKLYVGYGNGALAIIDVSSGNYLGNIMFESHPEAFQIEKSGIHIFVNLPSSKQIVVVDKNRNVVISRWMLTDAQANFSMALDEMHHRLFIGLCKPAKMVIFDTETGREVGRLDSAGDSDDIFYDEENRRIYMSCGEGFLNVFQQEEDDHYQMIATLTTAPGARTSLFVPEQKRLYIAIPQRAHQDAEIRVYETMSS